MRTCDVLISGGVVIDGTGGPRRRGDVAIIGDRIAAIDTAGGWAAAATVDAAGKIVAPGFIDTHTHDDRALLSSPEMTPKVSQGVTTVVAGNCGVSLAPLALAADPPPPMNLLGGRNWYRFATMARYRAQLAATPPALNVVPLLGHTTLRVGAMETVDGPAAVGEMAAMERALARALDEGAAGLSTGLAYPPAVRSSADEVTALALHVGRAGGIYATHVRDEGPEAVAAIEEGLAVGRETGVPVVFSHHKAWGRDRWGTVGRTLEVIERASASQPVALDVYPYTAGSSVLLKTWLPVSERVLITWSEPDATWTSSLPSGAATLPTRSIVCSRRGPCTSR